MGRHLCLLATNMFTPSLPLPTNYKISEQTPTLASQSLKKKLAWVKWGGVYKRRGDYNNSEPVDVTRASFIKKTVAALILDRMLEIDRL